MFCPVAARIAASSEPKRVFSGVIATFFPFSDSSVV